MHTLESLLKSISLRAQPECLKQVIGERKKYRNIVMACILLPVIGFYFLDPFIFDNKKSLLDLAAVLVTVVCGVLGFFNAFGWGISRDYYKQILDMHDNFSENKHLMAFFNKEKGKLTQEETDILLDMQFSDTTLKILHSAISENGYITYDDVAKMYHQDYSENKVINNQKKFLESGSFTKVNQQQNLQGLVVDIPKSTYKVFNSKSVL